jgi:recombination protein RecA
VLVRQKLTEGSEVTSNSMRPLAAAARSAAAKPLAKPADADKKSVADGAA